MNHFDSEYLFTQSMSQYLNTRDIRQAVPPVDESSMDSQTLQGDFIEEHLKDLHSLITDMKQEIKVYIDKKVKVATWGPWILKLQDASIDFSNQRFDFLLDTARLTKSAKQPIKYHGLREDDLLKAKHLLVLEPYEPEMAFITRIHNLLDMVPNVGTIDRFQGAQVFLNLSTINNLEEYFDEHTYEQMIRYLLALKQINKYQPRTQKLQTQLNFYQAAPCLHFPTKQDACVKCLVCQSEDQIKKSKYSCSGCMKLTGQSFGLCLDSCFALFHINPDQYLKNL